MSKFQCNVALILIAMLLASARADDPTLYVVGYAHLDTQWRWTYRASIEQYIPSTMHDNFSRCDEFPDYIFNFSGANRYRMMKEYYPADFLRVQQYVADGRWFPAGSSMEECDVNVPSAESLIRQVLYGNHFFREEFGKASTEFMLPDCFGFPASLPSILAHCGLKGFSTQKLTWGSAVGIPFNVGVWEGLDGSSIIAALNPGSYVSSINHDLSEDTGWLDRINNEGDTSGVYADYMYYGVGDMGGAPGSSSVQWLENSINGAGPVHVISATSDQMFVDIPPTSIGGLPHFMGDMLLTQHSAGSITSQCYMKRWNQKNELLADAAERVSVMAEWLGGPAYPQVRLNAAWALVMGGQFHDILPGTSHPKAYEFSWNDEILAMNQFAGVLDGAVGSIAAGLDTSADGVPLVIYNPLSIDREDVVEATVTFPGSAPAAVRVLGPEGGEVPSQVISVAGQNVKILFLASVPSIGLAVYDVLPAQTPTASSLVVTDSSLENTRYVVTLDGRGDVSIFDKAAGRAVLSSPARLAFSRDYPNDWPAWNIDWTDAQQPPQAFVDGPASIRIVENGAARIALEVTRDAQDSHFVQTIRLAAGDGGNRVEFDNTIDWQSSACNLKAVFPCSFSNPSATYNWEVGTILRGNNNPTKYEVPSHQWFDLTSVDGSYGVTVLSDSKYGSDKPDDATLRLTLIRTPGTHGGYQDQGTQDWGRHEILYGLAGHANSWRDGQTDWQAMRLSQPPIAFQTTSHSGALGRTLSLLNVDNPRVRVMAVKKAEDSNEIIVRLVELDGQPAVDVHVSMPGGILSARECDGQEQPIEPATVLNGELVTDLGGYRLRTFALTPAPSPSVLPAAAFQSLELPFDSAVTSGDGQMVDGGFDDAGACLPAEMLPNEIDYRGMTFNLGPTSGGALNAVACNGQQIALPAGNYNRLYLLAARANGDRNTVFFVDGEPVGLKIQDWGGYVGQWDNRMWEGAISEVAYSWPWAYLGLTPAYIRPDPVAWFSSHRHTASGGNDVYSYAYLFGYEIDLPMGATTLTLPTDDHVKVLAATIANDPATGTFPAQPLMDVLEREIVVRPVMTPIAATGWNRDVVVEETAIAPFGDDAQAFDVPNAYSYYELGLPGSAKGLPNGGHFVSIADGTTQVQLQAYDGPNALFMDSTQTSGTLTFEVGARKPYDLLAIFAASGNAASDSTGSVTITFTDGTIAEGLTYKAYDWFFVISSNGISDLGRLKLTNGDLEDGSSGNPRIYQTTLDLASMGLNVKPIESLTFGRADGSSSGRSTGIFAISGAATPIEADLNCDDQATIDDLIPFVLALTDPAGYEADYPDCVLERADMNGDGLRNGADIQIFVDTLFR